MNFKSKLVERKSFCIVKKNAFSSDLSVCVNEHMSFCFQVHVRPSLTNDFSEKTYYSILILILDIPLLKEATLTDYSFLDVC